MILAKLKPKFLQKCKIWVSQIHTTVFFFFFLLITSFKFAPKSIYQMARFQFQKYKIFQLLRGGGTSPQTPPVCWSEHLALWCSPPPTKIDLGSWLGGTCNFEVGEEFGEGFVDNA